MNLSLRAGQLALLMGPNGSGKTSLLRAIAGLAPAARGRIVLNGGAMSGQVTGARQAIAYLGHLDGLKKDLTVEENIRFISKLHGSSHALSELIAELGLTAAARRSVRQLSAGQKRRLALGRLALSDAPLWLLDEPVTALDIEARASFVALLKRHLAAGRLAIIATHEPLAVEAHVLQLGGKA